MPGRLNIGNNSSVTFPVRMLLYLLFIPLPGSIFAQSNLPDNIINLLHKYKHATGDSARVMYLSKLAFYYNDFLEDREKADIMAETAIRIAERGKRPGLLMLAYNNYLESTDNEVFFQKAMGYANKALKYSGATSNLAMRWRTSINLARIFISRYNCNEAISISDEALVIARAMQNNSMIAESYLYVGGSLQCKNQNIEAFSNYLRATDMAEKMNDPVLLRKCYSKLSAFYRDKMLYDDAFDFKQRESKIILTVRPLDSTALVWTQFDLQLITLRQKRKGLQEENVRKIIDFAIRTRNDRMKAWEFGLYRQYLLETDQLLTLYKFYYKIYPGEFDNLSIRDPEMYFRVKAYFKELEKLPDSAVYYFNKAEQLITHKHRKEKIYQSNFYNRYGQFLMRQGRDKEAIEKFTKSYHLAESDDYPGRFEYMLIPCMSLEALYKKSDDYKKAWYFASVNLRINDSIHKNTKNDQIIAENLRWERSQMELTAEKDRQEIRQGKNERNMMAGGAVFFIIVSLLVYRNYRNQKRLVKLLDEAKKQSDHLLLNILPHETAEELKVTGKASAKRFDEVTVMFTDFKDFTQASERMSAEELVDEINFYFSEFDNIISGHNIEKIKIIGDSYMCVGGLPVVNKTHAYNVVQAAMELQEFMTAQRTERSNRGKSFFELRIGIHTGPVVAGIVGLKKFAYDIWGDTVNTASRMENTCEPNKINISGETFEKIKDQFNCTYRGKVAVKHKGQIDMYFVD